MEDNQVLNVWKLFSKHGEAKAVTGAIFDAFVHANFRKWVSIDAEEMFTFSRGELHAPCLSYVGHPKLLSSQTRSRSCLERFKIAFKPSGTVIYLDPKKLSLKPEVYYQPKKDQQVGIDSLFIYKGYLYLLQMMGGLKHGIKPELGEFLTKIPGLPAKDKWRFIFIIPRETEVFNCAAPNIELGKIFVDQFDVEVCHDIR